MQALLDSIARLEDKYLLSIYTYVKSLFDGKQLPSHDENHQFRVWQYCKALLIELKKIEVDVNEALLEQAIIACLFHDTGLIHEIGEQHGQCGAEICADYLNSIGFPRGSAFNNILEAIEKHDDKSMRNECVSSEAELLNLNRLVSTADDLDAAGFIGVVRYIEIYLKRGVPQNQLPGKVLKNISNRRASFLNSYSAIHNYCDRQKLRFNETAEFFSVLDAQIVQNVAPRGNQLEVFRLVEHMLIGDNLPLDTLVSTVLDGNYSGYTMYFFAKLQKELNNFSLPYS